MPPCHVAYSAKRTDANSTPAGVGAATQPPMTALVSEADSGGSKGVKVKAKEKGFLWFNGLTIGATDRHDDVSRLFEATPCTT